MQEINDNKFDFIVNILCDQNIRFMREKKERERREHVYEKCLDARVRKYEFILYSKRIKIDQFQNHLFHFNRFNLNNLKGFLKK